MSETRDEKATGFYNCDECGSLVPDDQLCDCDAVTNAVRTLGGVHVLVTGRLEEVSDTEDTENMANDKERIKLYLRVTVNGRTCVMPPEDFIAEDYEKEDYARAVIKPQWMTVWEYKKLPEFEGY